MSGDERNGGGGGGRPRKDSPSALALVLPPEPEGPLEISSRGKIVIRSSSQLPGDAPPISEPPVSTPPIGRVKRDTPAERPRRRREIRERDSDPRALGGSISSVPAPIAGAADRGTLVLWAVIIALSAALGYALMR